MGVPTLGGFGQPGFGQPGFGQPGMGGAPSTLPYMGGQQFAGAPPFVGGQGPWGGIPGHQGGMPPGVIPMQAGSPGYSPYLLNSEINMIGNQMQGGMYGPPPPTLPYLGGQQNAFGGALPAPVNAPMGGIGGGFYGAPVGAPMYGSGVVNGR